MYKTYCLHPQGYSSAPSMFNRGCLRKEISLSFAILGQTRHQGTMVATCTEIAIYVLSKNEIFQSVMQTAQDCNVNVLIETPVLKQNLFYRVDCTNHNFDCGAILYCFDLPNCIYFVETQAKQEYTTENQQYSIEGKKFLSRNGEQSGTNNGR